VRAFGFVSNLNSNLNKRRGKMIREDTRVWAYCLLLLSTFLVVIVAQPFGAFGAPEKQLVVATWGGAWTKAEQKAFHEPFEKETGVKVIDVTSVGDRWSKLRTQVQSGNVEWDIISNSGLAEMYRNKDLLEKVDYSIVTNTANVAKESVGEYFVGGVFESLNIAYNRKKFPEGSHPKTWAEFWDVKKFPGARSLPNYGMIGRFGNILSALIADGVPPDKLLPIDYDRAFKKLDQIKPYINVWWTSGSQFQQILRDEEVVLAAGWDGRIMGLVKQGFPINIEWNQGHAYITSWAVVKGTKNKELAMRFLNSVLDPERQAVMSKEMGGCAPTNVKAFGYLDPAEGIKLGSHPTNLSKMFKMNMEFLAEHQKEIQERWEKWIGK
jgi:putative spermidine/putrescine transport system substrate-binding protein